MLMRIYAFFWVVLAAATVTLYVTGNFGEIAFTVLGVAFSAMFFAGFVGVLPWFMERHYSRYLRRPDNLSVSERVEVSHPHSAPLRVKFAS